MNQDLPIELKTRIHTRLSEYYQQRGHIFYMLLFGDIERRILMKHIEMIRKYYEQPTSTRD